MLPYIINRSKRLYQLYYYYLPLPVLSEGEQLVVNAFNLMLLCFAFYYLMFMVPLVVTNGVECLYYYITGNPTTIDLVNGYVVLTASRLLGSPQTKDSQPVKTSIQ